MPAGSSKLRFKRTGRDCIVAGRRLSTIRVVATPISQVSPDSEDYPKIDCHYHSVSEFAPFDDSAQNAPRLCASLGGEIPVSKDESALDVPAQVIPVPTSISQQGQAFLAGAAKRIRARARPAETNASETETQAAAAVAYLRPAAERFAGDFKSLELPNGAKLYRVTPAQRQGRYAQVAFMDIHGGAFIAGGGEMCQLLAKLRAMDYGVEVFSVDYRLLPLHPYPAPLDDCMAAYREALKFYPADALALGGASAGGNLAAALLLRAHDEGLPLPASLTLHTPALDMTQSGDSFRTNRYLDVNLYGVAQAGLGYGAGRDLQDPYISPLFGSIPKQWPPTILTTGTRDLLLSDTVRMHRALRRAGRRADLLLTEAGPHGGFMGQAPEDLEMLAECRRFMYGVWGLTETAG
jgi:monoterpene epsilon-lactone hydrolase